MTLNTDLEVLYHFTGNANDSSGNGNTGTVSGATLTTDKNSVADQAYSFDGSNDYISLPTDALIWGAGESYSYSVWIYPTNVVDAASIIGHNGWYNNCLRITTGEIQAVVRQSDLSQLAPAYAITANNWYFVTGTFNSSTGTIKLYVDGILRDTVSGWDGSYYSDIEDSLIGSRKTDGSNAYTGKIDEVRVYDRALTQDEVLQLYKGYDTDTDSVEGTQTIDNEMYLTFDSGSFTDATGNGNNATDYGSTSTTGIINEGRLLNGTSDWIDLDLSETFSTTKSRSYAFWFKTSYTGTELQTFLTYGDQYGSASTATLYLMNDGRLGLYTDTTARWAGTNGVYITPTSSVRDGNWHLFIVTIEANTEIKIYLDGDLELTSPQTVAGTSNSSDLQLSRRVDNGSYDRWFNGVLDEVAIWSRVLTPTEVTELYNSGAGLQYPYTTTGYANKILGAVMGKINGTDVTNISKFNGG